MCSFFVVSSNGSHGIARSTETDLDGLLSYMVCNKLLTTGQHRGEDTAQWQDASQYDAGELSVFCQSHFNKTLIGQAGSIGGKARQEVGVEQ